MENRVRTVACGLRHWISATVRCKNQPSHAAGLLAFAMLAVLRRYRLNRVVTVGHDHNRGGFGAGGVRRGLGQFDCACGGGELEAGDGVAQIVGGVNETAERRVNGHGNRLCVSVVSGVFPWRRPWLSGSR